MLEIAKRVSFIMLGLIFTSIGLKLLLIYDLTFGGTAGLASLLTFSTNLSWSFWFFLVNLPFFIISIKKIGKGFTIYSLLSITMISLMGEAFTHVPVVSFPSYLTPVLAGLFIGIGVTIVLNNGSSLGGIHILAVYLDEKLNINRGYVIFAFDVMIILFAMKLVGAQSALFSIITILIASVIIGRYKKVPLKTNSYSMTHSQVQNQDS